MSKRVTRVRYHLDAGDIEELPPEEIAAILRAADGLIMQGGRSLLVKVLKGSADKKLLQHKLDTCPVYGYYRHLPMAEIQARVDWVILDGYLTIEYDHRLPLLCYTEKGWAIERETYARELLEGFDELLASDEVDYDMTYLKERSRDMILLLLDLVAATGDNRYIPLLEAWSAIDYQKVRRRIRQVIHHLRSSGLPVTG